ncbi:nucleotide-diphospho-sugar transferase [Nadsonia fulvescens var. elongata DSM 6958]|uniref:Nucleotide-diphospho-sugar transferase n=1 Tax=Nadsonia fulvescens var. elongata DSM 6958 TaxID=857566 RepID=A0A1E3PG87_9ASCO|nr:nucleotide-diphospho-sugar transferase [Nadsonia fulvescens var. elongata DSM 6958]
MKLTIRKSLCASMAVSLFILFIFAYSSSNIALISSNNVGNPAHSDKVLLNPDHETENETTSGNTPNSHTDSSISHEKTRIQTIRKFMLSIIDTINKAAPKKIGDINNKEHYLDGHGIPVYGGHLRENSYKEPVRTKKYLASFLSLKENEVNSLKESHEIVIDQLPENFPSGIFDGNGIVYVGGGKYNWLVLLSIKALRNLGSKLPIEVIIPNKNEYNSDLCDRVFPSLNAKCLIMSDYLPEGMAIQGFQIKSMALMISSYAKILYLDSDNIPVKNPDSLFTQEPFISSKMVIWPDFWRRSTSPAFYHISNITVDETKHVRKSYHDDRDHPKDQSDYSYHDMEGALPEASSETGQILIDKETHARTLFLSLYYNVYGSFYYPLLSQGAAGEGDKETFLAAAHKLGQSYYQVHEFVREFGVIKPEGNNDILGMGQYDPAIDFSLESSQINKKVEYLTPSNYNNHYFNSSELMFLHTNWPKLHPMELSNGKGIRNIFNEDGQRHRLYGPELGKEVGYDLEQKIWNDMKSIVCDSGDIKIEAFSGHSMKDVCAEVTSQLEYLKSG